MDQRPKYSVFEQDCSQNQSAPVTDVFVEAYSSFWMRAEKELAFYRKGTGRALYDTTQLFEGTRVFSAFRHCRAMIQCIESCDVDKQWSRRLLRRLHAWQAVLERVLVFEGVDDADLVESAEALDYAR